MHLCDLFNFLEDLGIAGYADDTKIYAVTEKSVYRWWARMFTECFNKNYMETWKGNSEKCHLIMSC